MKGDLRAAPGFGLILCGVLLHACVHYQPRPLNPPELAASYRGRTLDDPGLGQFLSQAGSVPAGHDWRVRDLALAALYYQPELDRLRASWQAARAGEITARSGPQPGANAEVERTFAGTDGSAPWALALSPSLTYQFGGKRGARQARARARVLVSEAELWQAVWSTIDQVRLVSADWQSTRLALADADQELSQLRQVQSLLEGRFREGVASAADVAQLQTEVRAAALAVAEAERATATAVGNLARATAVPTSELERIRVIPDSAQPCDQLGVVTPDSLQVVALRSRWELGRAAAEYEEAESELRVEVSRQYPDLVLAPGLFFDHGASKWTIGLGLPGILFNRNRGPLAEAQARRVAAGAHFEAVQQQVLVELGEAMHGCTGARAQLAAADSVLQAVERHVEIARGAYDRGETSRTDLALVELARVRASRALHLAEQQRRLAGLALERAAGIWSAEAPARWPAPTHSPRQPETEEEPR